MNKHMHLKMTRLLLVSIVSLLIISSTMIAFAQPAGAQTAKADQNRLLTASGYAEVRIRPDLAQIRLGVQTEARTAEEARRQNAVRAGRIVDALKKLGIPESSIQTSTFQIYPVRRFPEDQTQPRGEPPIVGYNVTNVINVRTDKLDLVPAIIDSSVGAGANTVEDVSFTLRDQTGPNQTALRRAVANARQNADSMAKELGVRLVRVQSVIQGGAGVVPPPVFYRGGIAMEAAAAPTPVFPGEVSVNASVTLVYVIQ